MLMILLTIPRILAQAAKTDTSELPMVAVGFRELISRMTVSLIFPGSGRTLHLEILLIFIVAWRRNRYQLIFPLNFTKTHQVIF